MTDNESIRHDSGTPSTRRGAPAERITLGSPEAILAAIPYLLGFYPAQSLVVLGLAGRPGKVRVTFRYDLPDPADSALTAEIADHAVQVLGQQRLRLAVLAGYGPAGLVTPVLVTAMRWLEANGIELREAIRAEGGRYWCVLCEDPGCCSPDGMPFDPCSHPAAAAMNQAGLEALPDRAALSRSLLPPAGSAERIRAATRRAEQRLVDLGTKHVHEGGEDPLQATVKAGQAALQRAIRRYRAGSAITSADELAWLAVLVADLRVRDDAWARMDPAQWEAHQRLWTDVVRGAATEYVAAPASLLAFTGWQSGRGALAMVAIDRALAARPGYSMAQLIADAVQAGLPPSAARLPMTPSQVAAGYAARDERAGGRQPRRGRGRGNPGGEAGDSAGDSGGSGGGRIRGGAAERPGGRARSA
jgi:hypothetical protein